jgi:hypothetical protein
LSTVSLNFHFQSTGEIRRIFADIFAGMGLNLPFLALLTLNFFEYR